ncbi:PEPxxWA-CTERM sorting domain-containing protein [uncultured Sphingomonas sp.]|uniref:PEPxxWA-CTERM sorting domain-containing protein n=1 Tax=uncultured Sphingomonas sp. TaxID=158754 RepID=UPI003747B763
MRKGWMVGAATLAMTVPAAAIAAPATVTVTGTVLNGLDAGGQFAGIGANLAGLPFSAVFTVEAQPGNTVIQTGTLGYLFGRGAGSPVSAALTIGSRTYDFAGSFSGSARVMDAAGNGGTDLLHYMVDDTNVALLPPDNTLLYVGFDTLRNVLNSANYSAFDQIDLTAQDGATGQVRIANRDAATGTYGASTYANLSLSTIRASVMSPVPEPATWAMMIAGFAMTGAALRRRRATRVAVRFA